MPRLSDLVRTIHTSPGGRSDPRLSSVDLGHILGLTMAHEIGHILGLDHARSGVMKAAPDVSDLLQLQDSRLMFLPSEVTRMLQGLQARDVRRLQRRP
jgi:predicted Zn-dependent protease